jgi:hypothetical protein
LSFELHVADEPVCDVVPLTTFEKSRKAELESVIEGGLEEFLRVGAALAELRNKRLYRTEFSTFELYCRNKFGLARSRADQLIRSADVAQSLIESGCALPTNVTEAVIRPLASLPDDDDLRNVCWQLAESFAPARGPTVRLVARLCSVIRDYLENPFDCLEDKPGHKSSSTVREGNHRAPRAAAHEFPFCRPVARLAGWSGFSATIIVAGVDKLESATNLYHSCGILAERCRQVQTTLAANYPELASHA